MLGQEWSGYAASSRARQVSNLRPSLFVVLLHTFLDVRWCPEVGLSKRLLFLAVRRRSLPFSFYCCPTAATLLPAEVGKRLITDG